jgi:GT2 family glycosyltransferase
MVSAIIVSYNSSKFLPSCLDSVLSSISTGEIIVIDNASTDSSPNIVLDYAIREPRVRLIKLRRNVGFPKACNIATHAAKGDVVVLMNPDVIVEQNCFSTLLDYLKTHTDVAVVQPTILRADSKRIESAGGVMDLLGHGFHLAEGETNVKQCMEPREILYACFACAMIRRDVFLKLGGLDPVFFLYNEDLDFCLRAWLAGYRVVHVPQASVRHIGQHAVKQIPYTALFHGRKNRLITIFANYPILLMLFALGTLMLFYMGGAFLALILGNKIDFFAFVNSLMWFLKHMKYGAIKRSKVSKIKMRSIIELYRRNFIRLSLIGVKLHMLRFHLSKLGMVKITLHNDKEKPCL